MYSKSLVLLTTQIHQGIRLSSLKVLVTRVFRPASNLLLRLLHICNNATFTLLHSKRYVRSKIKQQGMLQSYVIASGAETNYEPCPLGTSKTQGSRCRLVQNNVAFQLKYVYYKALLKQIKVIPSSNLHSGILEDKYQMLTKYSTL